LNIVHGFYPEPTIGEYVLKALAKATTGKPKEIVDEALKTHSERFSREIKAQASILESLEQAKAGKAETPKVLEKVYRDFIEKPLAANQMLSELLEKYGPKDSRKITAYLLHSLGSDLKAHGAAIEPGRLSSLVTEIRGLQSVIGVLQFFKARVKLIDFLLKRENLPLPPNLKFEELAKTFVALAQERYPSPEKVTQSIAKFGAAMEILSKIIIISQMRDGTREVSLKLFRRDENRDDSIENRDKLFHAIIEALDGLEDELDALAEKQEQERLQSEAGDEPIQKKDEPIQKK
jgi:predicted transcriptional regulator